MVGEAVTVCDMPEPCKCPSLGSCQKRFLWTHKKVDLVPHPGIDLVLQVRDAQKCPQALDSKGLGLCFSEQAGSMFHRHRRMEVTRDLKSLNLLAKLMVVHCQILFSLTTAAIAEAILMQTSAEQVPSLHRVALGT